MEFFKILLKITVLLFITVWPTYGQMPNFSGFWLTPQTLAPTAMAGNNAYQLSAHYRRQGFEENSGYRTFLISAQLPLYSRTNTQFGTLGINLTREEMGSSYLFTSSGAMLTYLYDAHIAYRHHLVAGVQGAYYGRKMDWSQVTTSNQFVNGNFDPALNTGEQMIDNPGRAILANVGLGYYLTNYEGEKVLHIGAGLSNVNKGNFTYLMDNEAQAVPSAVSGYAHFRIISNPYFDLVSDLYMRHQRKVSDLTGGLMLRKGTRPRELVADNHLGIGLYYSQDHTGTLALQLIQPKWLIGIGYDIVFGNKPLRTMQNAVEVSIGWRALRDNQKQPFRQKKYKNFNKRKLPWQRRRRLPWQGR